MATKTRVSYEFIGSEEVPPKEAAEIIFRLRRIKEESIAIQDLAGRIIAPTPHQGASPDKQQPDNFVDCAKSLLSEIEDYLLNSQETLEKFV